MVDEDTFLVAALAAASSNEINKNLSRSDPGYAQLAATLNHRDILQGGRHGQVNKMTRGDIIRQGGYQQPLPQVQQNYQPQQPQQQPQYNIPPVAVNHDFNMEPLFNANVNSIPLGSTDARMLPMPQHNADHQGSNIVQPIVTDFQIPNFGGVPQQKVQSPAFSSGNDMSLVVLLQGIEKLVTDVNEIVQRNEKKINRIERKINEIYKHLNINPKEKND